MVENRLGLFCQGVRRYVPWFPIIFCASSGAPTALKLARNLTILMSIARPELACKAIEAASAVRGTAWPLLAKRRASNLNPSSLIWMAPDGPSNVVPNIDTASQPKARCSGLCLCTLA